MKALRFLLFIVFLGSLAPGRPCGAAHGLEVNCPGASTPASDGWRHELRQYKEEIRRILILVSQISALLLALAIAVGFLKGEVAAMVGAPIAFSEIWYRIVIVVICLSVAILAVPIANMVVDAIF